MSDSPDGRSQMSSGSAATTARGVPLSLSQQAALLPERLQQAQASNVFVALEFPSGMLETGRLDRAVSALMGEHEILRTVYPQDRRLPYQSVLPDVASVLEESEGEEALAALLSGARDRRFELGQEPPIRVVLCRTAARDVLVVLAHPVAADDFSLDALVAELLSVYDGASPSPAAQYGVFAAEQVKSLAGMARDNTDFEYWKTQLAGAPERAALAQPGPAGKSAALRPFSVPGLALGSEAEAEAVFSSLTARALYETGMGEDILIGIADPARPAEGSGLALGNFANYLVLRVAPAPERPLRELVAEVGALARRAREHASVRVEWLAHQLQGGPAFPFQVLVRVRRASAFAAANLPARELARRLARPHGVDIVVDVVLGADGPEVAVDVPAVLAGHPALDHFIQVLRRRCEEWASAPDAVLRRREDGADTLFVREAPADLRTTGLGGPPSTPEEHLLADAIRQVLELEEHDEVGRQDTFFALGGDSVTALRLVTALSGQGYSLDVQKVFEYPEIHQLAGQLVASGQQEAAPAPQPAAPMSASGLDAAALASLGQKFSQR